MATTKKKENSVKEKKRILIKIGEIESEIAHSEISSKILELKEKKIKHFEILDYVNNIRVIYIKSLFSENYTVVNVKI